MTKHTNVPKVYTDVSIGGWGAAFGFQLVPKWRQYLYQLGDRTFRKSLKLLCCACFGSTYTKIGTIQRRLAWPLRKDDTQIREAFHILRHSPPPDTICRSNTKNCEVLRGSFGGRRPVCAFRRASPKPEDTWNSLSPDPLSSQRRF